MTCAKTSTPNPQLKKHLTDLAPGKGGATEGAY